MRAVAATAFVALLFGSLAVFVVAELLGLATLADWAAWALVIPTAISGLLLAAVVIGYPLGWLVRAAERLASWLRRCTRR